MFDPPLSLNTSQIICHCHCHSQHSNLLKCPQLNEKSRQCIGAELVKYVCYSVSFIVSTLAFKHNLLSLEHMYFNCHQDYDWTEGKSVGVWIFHTVMNINSCSFVYCLNFETILLITADSSPQKVPYPLITHIDCFFWFVWVYVKPVACRERELGCDENLGHQPGQKIWFKRNL